MPTQASPLSIACSGLNYPTLATTNSVHSDQVHLENRFTVSKSQLPDFLGRWEELGHYIKQQSGFISANLKKEVSESDWKMTEEWESLDAYKKAVSTPEFQALLQNFPGKAKWFAQDLFPQHP